jgi:hypothetical protein
MSDRQRNLAFALALSTVVALFLPKLLWADSALYQELLTPRVLLWVGALTKLTSLGAGAVFAVRIARSFQQGGLILWSWRLLAVWMTTWAAAQAVLVYFQLVLRQSAPFPSPADLFFTLGYVAMLLAFGGFIRAYAETGLLGSARGPSIVAVTAAVPFVILGVVVLTPVVEAGGPPLTLAINLAYPAFDVAALVPTVVLSRMALQLRGGQLFWVWSLMSLGIVFLVAGDLLYAWFQALSVTALDPLLDAAYVAGYALVARAVAQQARVSVVRT